MKRFFISLCLFSLGWSVAMSFPVKQDSSMLQDFSRNSLRKSHKAADASGIEGSWRFLLGDYYFEDSSQETLEYVYEASFYNNILYFEEADEAVLPMAAEFNESTGELTFSSGKFGDFYGYGILVQLPSFFDPSTGKFTVRAVTASYDASAGKITFPENSAMQWWLYDEDQNPMFSLDAYTFEGAFKLKEEKTTISGIIINRDADNPFNLAFKDFSRIDFKDGNILFDNEEGLVIPLKDLATIHFGDIPQSSTVQKIIDDNIRIEYRNGFLSLSGLPENSRLDIYSLSGSKVITVGAYNGEPVDINSLAKGVYVVNSGKHSFKFIK